MAKQRLQFLGKIPATGLVVLAALLGGGRPPLVAGQQPAAGALQNARNLQEALQKNENITAQHSSAAPLVGLPEKSAMKKGPGTLSPPAGEKTHLVDLSPGKRDPFKLPPTPGAGGKGAEAYLDFAGPLPAGNRGLIISQLKLEGLVRQDVNNKMLAVVTNETRRAYFLTENDAVYNGVVTKITPDAVYFK